MALINGNTSNPLGSQWSQFLGGPVNSASAHGSPQGEPMLPDDAEMSDGVNIKEIIDRHFDSLYPPFEPQIISTPNKDYFLPALKVLRIVNGDFVSPAREVRWNNMELEARCVGHPAYGMWDASRPAHDSPDPNCDCGIYGSVNLEEIYEYVRNEVQRQAEYLVYEAEPQFDSKGRGFIVNFATTRKRVNKNSFALCIIEPSPDAKVLLCRKGWKASKAFISEIVGQTIGVSEVNELLSYAWHRSIDIGGCYESW